MKHKSALLLLFLSLNFCNHLTAQEAVWKKVFSGACTAKPKIMGNGFVFPADDRQLYHIDSDGKLLWTCRPKGVASELFSVNQDNFVYAVTGQNRLNFINPSGNILWDTLVPFDIMYEPVSGIDGRVYVQGKNTLACYGLHGTRKWILTLNDESAAPITLLNDNSILYVIKNNDSTDSALLISAFGEILQTFTFSQPMRLITQGTDGVLVTFADASISFFTAKNGSLHVSWTIHTGLPAETIMAVQQGQNQLVVFQTTGEFSAWNIVTAQKMWTVDVLSHYELQPGDLYFKNSLYYLTVQTEKAIHSFGITNQGQFEWNKEILQPHCDYYVMLPSGYMILTDANWMLRAYKLITLIQKKLPASARRFVDISNAYKNLPPAAFATLPIHVMEEISSAISKGDYGAQEKDWSQLLLRELYFSDNEYNIAKSLQILAQFESTQYNSLIAAFFQKQKNDTIVQSALGAAAFIAYDPDSEFLTAVHNMVLQPGYKSDVLLASMIDATYFICRFTGKQAILSRGSSIFSELLRSRYGKNTHNLVIKKLQELMSIEHGGLQ